MTTEPFDPATYLTDAESISAYLQDALEDDDPRGLSLALQDVTRAIGGVEVLAEKTGLPTRELELVLQSTSVDVRVLRMITKAIGATITLPGHVRPEPIAA